MALASALMLTLFAVVWLLGLLAAPTLSPTLARATLGPRGDATRLAGAAVSCGEGGEHATRCTLELNGKLLVVEHAAPACYAHYGGQPFACNIDYGEIIGRPSVHIPELRVDASQLSLAARGFHGLGTRPECDWAAIAQLTAALLPLCVALLLAARAARNERRWRRRIVFAVLSMPPLWLVLFLTLLYWGYID